METMATDNYFLRYLGLVYGRWQWFLCICGFICMGRFSHYLQVNCTIIQAECSVTVATVSYLQYIMMQQMVNY